MISFVYVAECSDIVHADIKNHAKMLDLSK